MRLIYFAKFYQSTAYLAKMIVAVTFDSRYFLLVLLIAVFGFGNAFYIIAANGDTRFTGDNFMMAFVYSYRTALGDFDTDGYADTGKYETLIYILWYMSTILTLIILLNLLIAIMGDTFGRIQETAESNGYLEITQIMAENEIFIYRKKLFGNK